MFQFKILHNILPTNLHLHRMNLRDSIKCPICPDCIQSTEHMFITCSFAREFWSMLRNWNASESSLQSLSKVEILYGIICDGKIELTLNHIILIAKYHIYCNVSSLTQTNFTSFITRLKNTIDIEKYIAYTSHTEEIFNTKWGNILALMDN